VANTANTQFDVTFATQTTPGIYRLTVGPRILDTSGHPMVQAFTAIFTVRAAAATFNSTGPMQAILDFQTTTSAINVGQDLIAGHLTVHVGITHSWIGDLVVKLRAPDGTTVTLFNRRGGSGHDLHATFDDAAWTAIANGKPPYYGAFRAEQAPSTFAGKNARGTWQLIVQDQAAGNEGTLTGWTLTIRAAAPNQIARPTSLEDSAAPAPAPTVTALVDAVFAGSLLPSLTTPVADHAAEVQPERRSDPTVAALAVATPSGSEAVDRRFARDAGGSYPDADSSDLPDLAWLDSPTDDLVAGPESW
jgi:subtilisin-like proprotein convertase family protein